MISLNEEKNKIVYTYGIFIQWAAVKTHSSEIKAAPHLKVLVTDESDTSISR